HTTWFWETFVLLPHARGYEEHDPRYGFLFNSYYEALGPRHTRPERGLITRPGVAEVREYRRHVDDALAAVAERQPDAAVKLEGLIALGVAHEEQHQELILTDIKHALAANPFPSGVYPPADNAGPREAPELSWISFAGGTVAIGAAED